MSEPAAVGGAAANGVSVVAHHSAPGDCADAYGRVYEPRPLNGRGVGLRQCSGMNPDSRGARSARLAPTHGAFVPKSRGDKVDVSVRIDSEVEEAHDRQAAARPLRPATQLRQLCTPRRFRALLHSSIHPPLTMGSLRSQLRTSPPSEATSPESDVLTIYTL